MDDDDLRRGKPTCHKVYGECIATLAGNALQAAAFETVLFARGVWIGDGKSIPGLAAGVLATSVGEKGMCGGQYLDMTRSESDRTAQELMDINNKKTGALLRAACMMGVLAASAHNRVDNSCMNAAKDYATYLGAAFQIRDDMLDVVGDAEEVGKPIGSDASNEKATYVTLLGLEECQRRVEILTTSPPWSTKPKHTK
jgi:geranylgeranyl pyrophosphate synthase